MRTRTVALAVLLVTPASLLVTPDPGFAGPGQATVTASIPGIVRFDQVGERLFRGGQPATDDFAKLRELGIDTVVSFRVNDEERSTVEALGMKFVHLPVSMKPFGLSGSVSRTTIDAFFKVVDDPASGDVFVHCRHGKDRTGLFVSLYRVTRQGWAADDAYREARDVGMAWWHFPAKGMIAKFADDND